jgi:hypothetical protein
MLAKTENQAVGAPQEAQNRVVQRTEGMEVSRDALLPPIVKLVQATTKDADKYGPGKFLRTDTEEVFDVLEVVPLVSKVTQTKWPEDFSREAQPVCWSSNGITADQGAEREGQLCHACPFFSPKPQKGKGREMCETGHNLILQDADTYTPFGMRLRSTGNRVMGLLSSPSIAQKAVVRLYSEKVTGDSGTWYQLKAKTLRPLDEADRDLAVATMRSYLETNLGYAVAEDSEAGDTSREPEEAGSAAPKGAFQITLRGEGELRYTASGKAVCNIMAETPQGYRKVVAWEALAERLARDVRHGDVLMVTGQYGSREWEGRDGKKESEPNLTIQSFEKVVLNRPGDVPAPAQSGADPLEGLPF